MISPSTLIQGEKGADQDEFLGQMLVTGPVQEGGQGWKASTLLVVTTTSVFPSVTLRLYLEESFSLDPVAMTTLLTKSSFHGGGWLTQKLSVLGEGVYALMGVSAQPVYSPPPKLPKS